MKLTLKILREDHPDWTWKAERYNGGYRYKGRKDNQRVKVQVYKVPIVGRKTYQPVWRVDDGVLNEEYTSWRFRNRMVG